MQRSFATRENERYPFCAPVRLHVFDASGQGHLIRGISVDASIYGLGVAVSVSCPLGTMARVWVHEIAICSDAQVRHVQPGASGFRMGLEFATTLYRQGIPGLDDLLAPSLQPHGSRPRGFPSVRFAGLAQRFRKRFAAA